MTTQRILRKLVASAVFLPLLLLSSCIDEKTDDGQPATRTEATVTFSLQLPGTSKPSTRALSETDENEVKTIEVLQFEPNGGNYIRTTHCTVINPGSNAQTKTFSVRIIKGQYDLMILANPRPRVKAGYTKDDTRQTVMEALYADLPTGEKWNAAPSSGEAYSPIPMWGEVTNVTIADNTSLSGTGAVQLVRMVAKVNVQVSGVATGKFLLKSVRVYNYNSRGSLTPAAANIGTDHIATAPTVPTGSVLRGNPANSAYPNPLVYTGTAITTPDVASEGEIYLFESKVGSGATLESNTCLVIGGEYDGSDVETFYRVDFANKQDNTWNYLPLLRNHKYIVDISTVSGKGFDDPTDAFNSAPVNIEANVLKWNDGEMGVVNFDGQNYLSVSQGLFTVGSDVGKYSVDIETDVKTGWEATSMDSWINLTGGNTGLKDTKTPQSFNVTRNDDESDRTGFIKITAGRLEYMVKVTQNIKQTLSITVSETTMEFNPDGELNRHLYITWLPTTNVCHFTYIRDANGGIDFTHPIPAATLEGGNYRLTFDAPALDISINPFAVKSGTLLIKTHNDRGDEISQAVILKQVKYNTVAKTEEYYKLDNSKMHLFSVRSNTNWKITNVADPDFILDNSFAPALLNQTGGNNTSDNGTAVFFKFITDDTGAKNGKKVTLTLTDTSGRMTDVTVILKGGTCGTDGVAVKQKIGNDEYLTHKYGDYCWMVENLKEGVKGTGLGQASAIYYGQGGSIYDTDPGTDNGQHYYTYAQAASICPTGWHLPTEEEAKALVTAVETSVNIDLVNWWCSNQGYTLAGFYNFTLNKWYYWGDTGHWWYGSGNTSIKATVKTNYLTLSSNSTSWYSVRCVMNQ